MRVFKKGKFFLLGKPELDEEQKKNQRHEKRKGEECTEVHMRVSE